MPNNRMAKARQTGLRPRPCGIIPVSALWILCRYRHKIHATGHGSRLDREGVTQPVKYGSDRYSREELIPELGAAFLSNESEILREVQFQNSAAYLASWIQKLDIPRESRKTLHGRSATPPRRNRSGRKANFTTQQGRLSL